MFKTLLRKLDGELDPTDIEIAWEAFVEAIHGQ